MTLSRSRRLRIEQLKSGGMTTESFFPASDLQHSYDCVNAGKSLSNWMFKFGHRGDLPLQSYEDRDMLKSDSEKASKKCEKCKTFRHSKNK